MSNAKEESAVSHNNTLEKIQLKQQQTQAIIDRDKEKNAMQNDTITTNTTELAKEITEKDKTQMTSLVESSNITQIYPNITILDREGEVPGCSHEIKAKQTSNAIVPLSSSLPSKLLRLHARRSGELLREQMLQLQNQSMAFQFGSDDSILAENNSSRDDVNSESFGVSTVNATSMSPVSSSTDSPAENSDEKVDVGMGSSIDGSEESEVDDELKPLAVDNHVLDVKPSTSNCKIEVLLNKTVELSEANLEKFHKHHHHSKTDNVYLHPNFKYEYLEKSPPPAVAPANSPAEQRNQQQQHLILQESVHRSFLNSSKKVDDLQEPDNSVISQSTGASDKPTLREIDTLDPSLVPDENSAAKIVEAVEFYFSNDSILKDAFLLKHVRRNKEGFVSLKLVSSFKYVRQLTKDWRVVGYAIRLKSKKIELNDLGTKVRRLEPLPNFDETMPSRTIVACDLPLEKLTIEKVSDVFSKCGEIALIRILKPGMAIPVDVRQFMNKYPEMQQKECALIEYLESSAAREARNLQGPFKVYEMVAPKKKTGKKPILQISTPIVRMVESYRHDQNYERTRGGSFSGVIPQDPDLRFKLRRNNSDIHHRIYDDIPSNLQSRPSFPSMEYENLCRTYNYTHQNHPRANGAGQNQEHQTLPSLNVNKNYFPYGLRRYSSGTTHNNGDIGATNMPPLASNRDNTSSGMIRRGSNTIQEIPYNNKRASNCMLDSNSYQRREANYESDYINSRRASDTSQPDFYRKNSQSSMLSAGDRRFSNDFMPLERTYSNSSDYHRRKSNDFQPERKSSLETHIGTPFEDSNVGGGGGGYNVFPRRYSNSFNNVSSKFTAFDNGGRRISTDSGYDRRYSLGSEYEGSPRSRTSSFLNNYKQYVADYDGQPRSRTGSFLDGSPRSRSGSFAQRAAESLIRTPHGPDGSRGFDSRIRKINEAVPSIS